MRCFCYAAFLLLCGGCSGEAEGDAKLTVGTPAGSGSAGVSGADSAGTGSNAGDAAGGQSGEGSSGSSGSRAGSGGGGRSGTSGGAGNGSSGDGSGAGSAGMMPSAGMDSSGGGGTSGTAEPPEEWGVYDIGEIPSEMTIAFPDPPEVTHEVEVSSLQELNAAASQNGTRVRVTGMIGGGLAEITGSDIEVVMNDGAAITSALFINPGVSRVALLGGRYEKIEMRLPSFSPRPVAISTDILIDGVVAETNNGTAIRICAHRAAVLRSHLRSTAYGVYSAAAQPQDRSEDLVIAGNQMFSTGAEATIRLVDVNRSVTVENRAENMMKHTYRIHGVATDAFAARNVFVTGGVGFGFLLQTDNVGRAWFDDNEIYHRTTDLFSYTSNDGGMVQLNRINMLTARNNRAFTRFRCIECQPIPDHWVFENNTVMPEREPPPAN